jgi:hypothetical protein
MTEPKTLGDYRNLCLVLFGEKSKSVKYFDDLIAKQGRHEIVIAPFSQMTLLIGSLEVERKPDGS